MKKFLGILPESIAGRLIISGLLDGFEKIGYQVYRFDQLKQSLKEFKNIVGKDKYDFLLSYNYTALEYRAYLNLNIAVINYFSDVIESDLAGKKWQKYYKELKTPSTYTFYWDKKLTGELQKKIHNINYLPLFVNTDIYRNLNLKTEYDLMFAGRLTFENRLELLLLIENHFPDARIALYCYPDHFEQILKLIDNKKKDRFKAFYKGFIEKDTEMAKAINMSKIVVNTTSQGKGSLNYRLFETIACEKFLLTDYKDEINNLFSPGDDIIYYKNEEELLYYIKDYLANPDKYLNIIKSGRKTVEKNYDSKIAAKKIVDIICGKKNICPPILL